MMTRHFAALGLCLFCLHCGSDSKDSGKVGTGGSGTGGGSLGAGTGGDSATSGTGGDVPSGGGGSTAGMGGTPGPGTGGEMVVPGAGGAPVTGAGGGNTGGAATSPGVMGSPGFVRCGAMLDDKLQSPYTMITGRQVFIDYPCDLPAGTPVTFILNLHGTQSVEDGKHYIREYNKLGINAQEYHFIVATPKAIGSQWGNGDNGQDAPHLAEVVKWVYTSFPGFSIKQMWVTGHSWGAAYSLNFVCLPEYADKIRGLMFMSGGASLPTCADRLSIIATVGETDIVPGQPDQSGIAMKHGCAARSERQMGQDKISEWASCSPGWVHQDWLMLGKGHGFDPKDWPDMDMTTAFAEAVRSTQPM